MSLHVRGVVPSNVVNDQDQGALATIAAALGLTTTGILLCIRLLIRWPWQSLFGQDDTAVLIASVLGIVHSIVILTEVPAGLGIKSARLTAESSLSVRKMIFVSDLIYVCALFWSKLAVCILVKRICIARRHIKFANILSYFCVVLGLLSLLVVGIRERTRSPWDGEPATGLSTLYRWIAMGSFACVLDLAIAIAPFAIVWDLQMRRSKKAWVILGFIARLPTIPLAVLRLTSLSRTLLSSEVVFDRATTEILTLAELSFSIVSATIPCLRIFMQSVNTGLLGKTTFDESTGDRSKASYLGSRSGTFGNTSRSQQEKSRKQRGVSYTSDGEAIELQDRTFGRSHANAVAGSDKQSVASDSSERAIIVRQTIDVVYT